MGKTNVHTYITRHGMLNEVEKREGETVIINEISRLKAVR